MRLDTKYFSPPPPKYFPRGEARPENFTQVVRYTVDMATWELDSIEPLVKDDSISHDFEFSNINPGHYTKPYRYAYMTHNVFMLHGSVVKLDVTDGSIIR